MKYSVFILFCVLNILDVVTTYNGMSLGLIESNPRALIVEVRIILPVMAAFCYLTCKKYVMPKLQNIVDFIFYATTWWYVLGVSQNCLLIFNKIFF